MLCCSVFHIVLRFYVLMLKLYYWNSCYVKLKRYKFIPVRINFLLCFNKPYDGGSVFKSVYQYGAFECSVHKKKPLIFVGVHVDANDCIASIDTVADHC